MSGRAIRVLNVAEKPSVAKSVSEILSRRGGGGMRVRNGRSRYNRVFEFEYMIRNQRCSMVVTSVTGHLMELDFDERYKRWASCDPATLYQAPVRKFVPQDKLDIKTTLEEEAKKCEWLVLWLDCDREGENIAFEVIEVCTGAKNNLNIYRAHFSALIEREIHEAAQNLVRPNKLFADAVDARQEIDLRIGASFTRFQTMLLKDAFIIDFGEERNLVLSYGPCQFPTLGFIVERYWEIQAHEPEEFWTINCSHTSEDGTASFTWIRGHLFDYASAIVIYEMCTEEPTATVINVKNNEKLKYPPYPLNTIELQKRASRYFRMSSEQTMKVAEQLYQAGFISYPRTETDNFSPNTDLAGIVRDQAEHPAWGPYAQRLLDPDARLWRNPSNGDHDDKAHPPIHPTKFSTGESNWTQDHSKLYELVVRHFLACVSQPAVGAETTVEIDIAGEQFHANGRAIIAKNYLDVYRFDSWGGSLLPTYTVGQQFIPTSLTLDSGVTRPPPLLSEADLLSCMDKAGIGTDATMHDHIKKLLDRFYATKDANTRFSPTNLGEALVMGYDDMGYELWKPYLRSMMEADMRAVSMGTKTKSQVLEACLQQMKACFLDAKVNKAKLLDAMQVFFQRSNRPQGGDVNQGAAVRPCGACRESDMALRRTPNGAFMVGCMRYPLCRNVVWLPGSISEVSVTTNICPTCTPGPVSMIQFKFRRLEIPPNYDVDHLGCIGGCDTILRELTEICGRGPRNDVGAGRGQGATETPRSTTSGTHSRLLSCTNCNQTGHSFDDCPSRFVDPRAPQSTSRNNGRYSDQLPCRQCGGPCVQRTANTENNRGRKFYKCQSEDCGFFIWEDNILDNSMGRGSGGARGRGARSTAASRNGGHGRGRGRARARGRSSANSDGFTFVTATGEPVSGRCYICGDPSHFANTCPERGET
ncbi:topoisomerase 3alpha isoform X2 [Carex rostrata]